MWPAALLDDIFTDDWLNALKHCKPCISGHSCAHCTAGAPLEAGLEWDAADEAEHQGCMPAEHSFSGGPPAAHEAQDFSMAHPAGAGFPISLFQACLAE